jgi:hypothetical protein
MRDKPLAENKWHINKQKNLTIEWRYFNFQQSNISGLFSYVVLKTGKIGKAYSICRLYTGKKKHRILRKIKLSNVHIENNDIQFLTQSSMNFISPGTAIIRGNAHGISWDLEYTNNIKQGIPAKKYRISPLKNLSWKIYMPSASVKGIIRIENKTYRIKTDGYMDGNWGRWIGYDLVWSWLQFNSCKNRQKHFSVALGELRGFDPGIIIVIHGKERILFDKQNYNIRYQQWNKKRKPCLPEEIVISADNGEYVLRLKTKLRLADKIVEKTPFLSPDICLFEERVKCYAELFKKADGKVKLVHKCNGDGFSEYSEICGGKLKPIFSGILKIFRGKHEKRSF